ncbi:MAG: PIN domain-containing protein [Pirellulales bacterium]
MTDKIFLDTNILIYAIEPAGPDPDKAATALGLAKQPDVRISTQVLGEFYRAVTSPRRKSPLTHDEATAWIQLWKRFDVTSITVPHLDLALEIVGRFRIGYYDALILAAAQMSGCQRVYSEDLQHGQNYGGVAVINPFSSS